MAFKKKGALSRRSHSNVPKRRISNILQLLGILSFSLSYKYLHDNPSYINESYGWHFQFLTIIGLTGSMATFVAGVLANMTHYEFLFYIKNKLAQCFTPLEILITILYWGICSIDRSLIIPPGLYLAPIADIGFHAMPALLLGIDFFYLSPPWRVRLPQALGLSFTISFLYWNWVEHCHSHNKFYPYPLFELLNTTQRFILFSSAALLMAGSIMVLQVLYRKVNC
ncbi:BgTH12-00015 [Blumeria graminis f. sp. triticale]|uniref:Bgt-4319 n=3 Tax=Blumeria graminis TaxID=34373 RepID=A0A9X9MKT8_BLUGR|nr:hypothetical protein BGT96224_4319 [Blumeria graminis f. sp. tritici 96224]CAD6504505.1 BgTH12-00015 [Blumeria graminis f. sp. triticale]VDB92427.1 Bgt-4319 [Blumeria graminis f. sp. tritici]